MISTWITDEEAVFMVEVQDKELNELFQEVRKKFKNILIEERRYDNRNWWQKLTGDYRKRTGIVYTVYNRIHSMDAQIINFPQDHEWSINTGVSKAFVMTYFFGLLTNSPKD